MNIWRTTAQWVPPAQTFVPAIALLVLAAVLPGCSGNGCGCPEQLFSFGSLHPAQASEVIADNQGNIGFVVLDVRRPEEFASGHLTGAVNLDFNGDFTAGLANLDVENIFLVYCKGGGRSSQAVTMMEGLGFDHLFELWGGIDNWVSQGFAVE